MTSEGTYGCATYRHTECKKLLTSNGGEGGLDEAGLRGTLGRQVLVNLNLGQRLPCDPGPGKERVIRFSGRIQQEA